MRLTSNDDNFALKSIDEFDVCYEECYISVVKLSKYEREMTMLHINGPTAPPHVPVTMQRIGVCFGCLSKCLPFCPIFRQLADPKSYFHPVADLSMD